MIRVPSAALRFRPPAEPMAGGGRQGGGKPGAAGESKAAGVVAASANGGAARDAATLDRRTVFVLRDDKPVAIPVKLGVTDGSTAEIVEGDLKAGDLVITEAISADSKPPGGGMGPGGGMRRVF